MIRLLLKRAFARFGARHGYDTGYLARLADADLSATLKLAMARSFLEHRGPLPRPVWRAAQLRAVLHADCGPCLALAASLAKEEGMGRATIAAILRGTVETEDMRLAVDYADAVLSDAPGLGDIVTAVRSHYGDAGLAALSIAVVSGGFYPLFKRGLGEGASCRAVLRELEAG